MLISPKSNPRNNNLNLIRFVAAILVIVSHSYPIVYGKGFADPLYDRIALTIGEIAVHVFFVISGFLVTISLMKKQSLLDYFIARVVRIYPALIIMLLFTILFIALPQSTYGIIPFLTNKETLIYFIKNATIITGGYNNLPGLFENNPYSPVVNGSLWTLLWELRMYMLLAVLFAFTKLFKIQKHFKFVVLSCFAAIIILSSILYNFDFKNIFPESLYIFNKLGYLFFLGAVLSIFRYKIYLDLKIVIGAIIFLLFFSFYSSIFFQLLYYSSIGYIVFYLGYIPKGFVLKFNNFGDYSYGIYIYAFPIQQTIVALYPNISLLNMMLLSISLTLVMAYFSWHFIEKKMIENKNYYYQRIREKLILISSNKLR